MITVSRFADRPVAVFGLGRSGIASALSLAAGGATVWAWDDNEKSRAAAAEWGVTLKEPATYDWRRAAALLLSPGVPLTHPAPHPVVTTARQAGCPVIGDIELLALAQPKAAYVGITGTNGKSTTTALIGHILKEAGRTVETGGNLGAPALGLKPLEAGGIYVLELSSYQLDLIDEAAFDVAVFINLSPDHLDRHGGMDGYVAAKRRIFGHQKPHMMAIVGVDDDLSRSIFEDLKAEGGRRVVPISCLRRVSKGVFAAGGRLVDDMEGAMRSVIDLAEAPTLPGEHNWQNAAAAYAAARAVGVEREVIAKALLTYPGLAHRQERIASVDGIPFINDSKATNADAAARALACYDAIYWIAGGLAKEGGLAGTEPYYPRIRRAFLIGAAEAAFAETLAGQVPVSRCGTLEVAVREAHKLAAAEALPGAVVLLSPACASFDQFTSFEHRGDAFRDLVADMARARRAAS
jgi:UDP-N-acetylmuramoylalanine--D-glutamate ligase